LWTTINFEEILKKIDTIKKFQISQCDTN